MKLDSEISSASLGPRLICLIPRLILAEEMWLGTRLQAQLVYETNYNYKFDRVIKLWYCNCN